MMDHHKELYRLWVEYLKRSESYKELCQWVRARRDDPAYPLPQKFKRREDGGPHPLVGVYMDFGDVFSVSFDEWWGWREPILARNEDRHKGGAVLDYLIASASIEKDLDGCIDAFRRFEGREPSADEMKRYFLQIMRRMADEQHTLFLRVNLASKPEEIEKGLKALLKTPQVKKRLKSGQEWAHWFHRRPTGKPRLDELQRYLDVYDLWAEKVRDKKPGAPGGWKQVIEHFEPERKGDKDHIRREYIRYKQIAGKIIRNVERGVFPGPY